MSPEELKQRTKKFAIQIIKLCQILEKEHGNTGRKIADQLLRSGTSVFANYRAACRCKSAKDFIHKIGTVVEESDESLGWLELLIAADIIKSSIVMELVKEADEITAIMTSSRNTAINNQNKN